MRTVNPALSPIPNVTAFGDSNTVYAQLIYDGVEQFSCLASSCKQTSPSSGASTWTCSDLNCTCPSAAAFCGGPGSKLNIGGTVNGLTGPLTVACDAPSGNGAHCGFQQDTLNLLFGSSGLQLDNCQFGECVRQNVIDTAEGISSPTTDGSHDLSTGVIAGLAVIGALVALVLGLFIVGFLARRKARHNGGNYVAKRGGVGVQWSNIYYTIPLIKVLGKTGKNKYLLQGVSGTVQPGTMMAILGPSGTN
jgi:hypothetical protein